MVGTNVNQSLVRRSGDEITGSKKIEDLFFLDFGLPRFQIVSSHVALVPVGRLVRRLKQAPAHLRNMRWCNPCKIVGRAGRWYGGEDSRDRSGKKNQREG